MSIMKCPDRIHVLSKADALQPLRRLLRELIMEYKFTQKSVDDIVIAINEACMNVIQHAYHNKDNEEIVIELVTEQDELIIKITDFAQKSDHRQFKSRDLEDIRPGGLGVHLIHELMDKVEYTNIAELAGNQLEMRKGFDI